jgi:raffinose/stachyose/melibiose transport system substrate-binding protein
MRKVISILMSFVLVLGFVLPASAATTTTSDNTDKPATIRLLSWWPQSQMQGSLDAFEKAHPNIKIDFQFGQTGDPYNQLAKTQFAAGAGPDVFLIGGGWQDYQKAGNLLDITGKPFLSNFSDAGLKATNKSGKQYGVPVDSWFSGIFVNKDLAKKAGVKLPFNSQADFVSACNAFKKIGVIPLVVAGGAKTQDVWRFAMTEIGSDFYYNNPNYDSQINAGKATFAKGYTPALKNWYTLVQKGIYNQSMLGMDQAQADAEFTTGKAAMTYGGNWSVDGWMKANPKLNITMIPWAGKKPGSLSLMAGVGMSWAVNSASANKDAALTWLAFMSTKEGLLPLQKKINCGIFLKNVKYSVAPQLNDSLAVLSSGKTFAPWVYWDNSTPLINEFILAFQQVLGGKMQIEDVGAALDKTNKTAASN